MPLHKRPKDRINRIAPVVEKHQGGGHFNAAFDDPMEYIRKKNKGKKNVYKF
jgi:hypothetical protein